MAHLFSVVSSPLTAGRTARSVQIRAELALPRHALNTRQTDLFLKPPFGNIGVNASSADGLAVRLDGRVAALNVVSFHHGHGFKAVRGLPVARHTREENATIYAGISSHVAPVRGRQDTQYGGKPADVVLAHIKDLSGVVDAHRIGALAYTTDKQVFHTDASDVIALLALGEAAEGGQSFLSNSWNVYNELAATWPNLIHTLAEPWDFDEFGKANRDGKTYSSRPLLYYQIATVDSTERLVIQYARGNFTVYLGLPRSSDIPPITEAQAEALDALHFIAERYAVHIDFRDGNIQYLNNLSIFHARSSFTDSAEKQRHLVRFWLRNPENAWKTPDALLDRWDRVYGRGSSTNSVFPLEPTIRSASARNEAKANVTNGGSSY